MNAGAAISEGLRFTRQAPQRVLGALALQTLVVIATGLAPGVWGAPLGAGLIRMPFSIILSGALLRLALGGFDRPDSDGVGPSGLQWTVLEWRLLGLRLLLGLIFGALAFIAFIAIAIAIGVVVGSTGISLKPDDFAPAHVRATVVRLLVGPVGITLVAVCTPMLILSVYLGLRLALASMVVAAEHRVSLARSWALSRGAVWPLFAVALMGALLAFAGGALGGVVGAVIKLIVGAPGNAISGACGAAFGAAVNDVFAVGALTQIYRQRVCAADAAGLDTVFA